MSTDSLKNVSHTFGDTVLAVGLLVRLKTDHEEHRMNMVGTIQLKIKLSHYGLRVILLP